MEMQTQTSEKIESKEDVSQLNAEASELEKAYNELVSKFKWLEMKYRRFCPDAMESLGDIQRQIRELEKELAKPKYQNSDEYVEKEPEQSDELEESDKPKNFREERKEIKRIYRRISRLAHPDKQSKKLTKDQSDSLTNAFVEANSAYKEGNLDYLLHLLGDILGILNGQDSNSEEYIKSLKKKIDNLTGHLENAKQSPMFSVWSCDASGHESNAKAIFNQMVSMEIHEAQVRLQHLRSLFNEEIYKKE